MIYNPKDISISRKNADSSSFEEWVLSASSGSVVMFDSASNLVAVPTSTLITPTASYAIEAGHAVSASYAPASGVITSAETASYLMDGASSIDLLTNGITITGSGRGYMQFQGDVQILSFGEAELAALGDVNIGTFNGNVNIERAGNDFIILDSNGINITSSNVTVSGSAHFFNILKTSAGDVGGAGSVEAQFGSALPFYMMANFPALGFNSFYAPGVGFVYGAGSSNQYGTFQAFNPNNGIMTYYTSPVPGNDGDTWSATAVFVFTAAGQIQLPAYTTPGILANDGSGIVYTTLTVPTASIAISSSFLGGVNPTTQYVGTTGPGGLTVHDSSGHALLIDGGNVSIALQSGNFNFNGSSDCSFTIGGAGYYAFNNRYTLTVGNDVSITSSVFAVSSSMVTVPNIYVSGALAIDSSGTASIANYAVIAGTAFQLPYSSSTHTLTLVVNTGSAYFNATTNVLSIYNGTAWKSVTLT